MTWGEEEYVAYLERERLCYAWVLHRHGGFTVDQARAAAEEFYDYRPSDDPWRDLVFHDRAWHWAMRRLFGDSYGRDHPELSPSAEYRPLW